MAILIWPKVITDDYAEVTITDIQKLNGDEIHVFYQCELSANTTFTASQSNHGFVQFHACKFPFWPSEASAAFKLPRLKETSLSELLLV